MLQVDYANAYERAAPDAPMMPIPGSQPWFGHQIRQGYHTVLPADTLRFATPGTSNLRTTARGGLGQTWGQTPGWGTAEGWNEVTGCSGTSNDYMERTFEPYTRAFHARYQSLAQEWAPLEMKHGTGKVPAEIATPFFNRTKRLQQEIVALKQDACTKGAVNAANAIHELQRSTIDKLLITVSRAAERLTDTPGAYSPIPSLPSMPSMPDFEKAFRDLMDKLEKMGQFAKWAAILGAVGLAAYVAGKVVK